LVVRKVRERLADSKQAAQKIDKERFNPKNLMKEKLKKSYQVTLRNRFAAMDNLEDNGHINRPKANIRENIKILA
jgi:hypothetical protein